MSAQTFFMGFAFDDCDGQSSMSTSFFLFSRTIKMTSIF